MIWGDGSSGDEKEDDLLADYFSCMLKINMFSWRRDDSEGAGVSAWWHGSNAICNGRMVSGLVSGGLHIILSLRIAKKWKWKIMFLFLFGRMEIFGRFRFWPRRFTSSCTSHRDHTHLYRRYVNCIFGPSLWRLRKSHQPPLSIMISNYLRASFLWRLRKSHQPSMTIMISTIIS